MKRILFALTMFGLLLPAALQVEAADVSFDFFYNNLTDGNWVEVGDYGYCWQPSVAVSDTSWRPYADGYWAYTDVGWTWVSNEDFGWATYHYGRWARVADTGWVWIPGTEWGPAWVSWRTGGDQVGWAPLPPSRSREPIYEGRAITGQVDIEFDIGPAYYNFVDVRYIGEPRLRERIYEPSQNVTFINNTVNVTNITYSNSTVYNYGPDYNQLSQYSAQPIQRLTIERQTNTFGTGAGFQANAVTKIEGGKLVVAAPMTIQKAPPSVAPKNVKAKIAQPKIETGWSGVSDSKAKAQLQQKMKAEDAKKVPPPTLQPRRGADEKAQTPAASPAARGASPAGKPAAAAPATPAAPVHNASPATSPMPAHPPAGKGKNKGQRNQPIATPSASASTPAKPDRTGAKYGKPEPSSPAATSPSGAGALNDATATSPEPKQGKGKHGNALSEEPAAARGVPNQNEVLKGKAKAGGQVPAEPAGESPAPKKGNGPAEPGMRPNAKVQAEGAPGERVNPSAKVQPEGASAKGGREKPERTPKKKKGAEESPAPTP